MDVAATRNNRAACQPFMPQQSRPGILGYSEFSSEARTDQIGDGHSIGGTLPNLLTSTLFKIKGCLVNYVCMGVLM
jgi:hypothetical protein